ncbi:MAG: TRL-like family protein [Treponema sp.]|jgi:predicted small secreted protein|nr:TRL-like family protein [Treponema sp.]
MKKLLVLLMLAVTIVLVGCASTSPGFATDNPIGSKIGEASATTWFGFLHTGDSGIITAANNGGISRIGAVDYRATNFLIVQQVTTVVAGD